MEILIIGARGGEKKIERSVRNMFFMAGQYYSYKPFLLLLNKLLLPGMEVISLRLVSHGEY